MSHTSNIEPQKFWGADTKRRVGWTDRNNTCLLTSVFVVPRSSQDEVKFEGFATWVHISLKFMLLHGKKKNAKEEGVGSYKPLFGFHPNKTEVSCVVKPPVQSVCVSIHVSSYILWVCNSFTIFKSPSWLDNTESLRSLHKESGQYFLPLFVDTCLGTDVTSTLVHPAKIALDCQFTMN